MTLFNSKCSGVISPPIGSPGRRASNKVEYRTVTHRNDRIATWNVRSLYAPGKVDNVFLEMTRLNINILGLSDIQWNGSGKHITKNGIMYYSGNDDASHRYGVGIIVDKRVQHTVSSFVPFSDRIVLLKLTSNKVPVNVIQVYAPTADKDEDEIESFYQDLAKVIKPIKKHEVLIIMGDLNAKVGQGEVTNITGKFGLGLRNERGDRLIEFCQREDMIITNTLYQLPPRRLYTWKAPSDGKSGIIRNQIDYIMIRRRFRNTIKSVKTYPGADITSDHNPVVAAIHVKLKKLVRKTTKECIDPRRLKDNVVYKKVEKNINEKLNELRHNDNNNITIDQQWQNIKQVLKDVGNADLKSIKGKNKEWMTQEILDLMVIRGQYKNKDVQIYKTINNEIRSKIRQAKEKWLLDECREVEAYQDRYDFFNMHKKVKEMTGRIKRRQPDVLVNKNGDLIVEPIDKLARWSEYIQELFNDNRIELENPDMEYTGPEILREELEQAIKNCKSGKAAGPDEVPAELLKLIGEDSIDILLKLFNNIYETGRIPSDWLASTFVTLPKKNKARECSDHRIIALMSHTLKIFLKIIHNRIYKDLEQDISDTQMGFRKGVGTREALFGLNVLRQRCLDMNHDMYICFIDFQKAFDRVQHTKLLQILKRKNIDSKNIRIISNLYWHQTARVKVGEDMSEEIKICRGVRQGCVLSPLLFNVYSEGIFEEALSEETGGIVINGERLNNLRYADDTVIFADSLEDLQHLVEVTNIACKRYGLDMNLKKTKVMTTSKNPSTNHNRPSININNNKLEWVSSYKYLGTWVTETAEHTKEIKCRIEVARSAFIKMNKILCSRDITLELRTRILKCYIFSILLYGMEAWTLKSENNKNIEAFEMWCYRRMLRIPWVDKVSNEEVLRRMNKAKEISNTIKGRKLEYLGHVLRGDRYNILKLIIQGKIKGKRTIGRRRISWLRNLREWFGCTSAELFRRAIDKVRVVVMISNLR